MSARCGIKAHDESILSGVYQAYSATHRTRFVSSIQNSLAQNLKFLIDNRRDSR